MSSDGRLPPGCSEQDINEAGGDGLIHCECCGVTDDYQVIDKQCPRCGIDICDVCWADELNCPNCGTELKPESEDQDDGA